MAIYLTSLEDPATVDNVLAFLEPYVPYTLGLIGNIVNSRPGLVRATRVYTSFEVDFGKPLRAEPGATESPFSPPPLFSIIVLQPREQARFFCSADLRSSEPATAEEEAHVQEFFKEVIPIVAAFPPDNTDGPMPEYDILPIGAKGRGYHIGRVHGKWVPCLDPITIQRSGPLVCLIRPPPSPSSSPPRPLSQDPPLYTTLHTPGVNGTPSVKPDRWAICRFRPSDIDFIHSISPFPRHKAYLESRAHTSISIHDAHLANGTLESNSNPVACLIYQADGSLAALWVEPSHRGLGLGDLVLKECTSRLETYHGFSGKRVTGTGILGWQWADASPENARSIRFFLRQEGWKVGWGMQWIAFDPDADPTAIDWSLREVPTEESASREWGKNPRILVPSKDNDKLSL